MKAGELGFREEVINTPELTQRAKPCFERCEIVAEKMNMDFFERCGRKSSNHANERLYVCLKVPSEIVQVHNSQMRKAG